MEKVIQNRPIRQPDRRGFSEAIRLTAVTFAIATPFVLYVSLSAHMMQEEYRLSRLVEGRRELTREQERLILQKARLLSPDVVTSAAAEKLGMVEEDAQEMRSDAPPPEKKEAKGQAKKPGNEVEPAGGPGLPPLARGDAGARR